MISLLFGSFLVSAVAAKKTIFEAKELSEKSDISVSIHSFVPAEILWNASDDATFTITIYDNQFEQKDDDQLDLKFLTNSSYVTLNVTQVLVHQVSPAAATGTGSRAILNASQILILPWVSAVTGNWRHIVIVSVVLLVSFVADVFAQTLAQAQYTDKRKLAIDILAPRRLRYKNISLISRGGIIRYRGVDTDDDVQCSTGVTRDEQQDCSRCCFGQGKCMNNSCQCDHGYSSHTSCQLENSLNTIYTHPLDPRLLHTKLPDGDEIYVYNMLSSDSDAIKTRMVVKMSTVRRTFVVEFDQYGHIKRMHESKSENGVQLQIVVSRGCQVRMYNKLPKGRKRLMRRMNICYTYNTRRQTTPQKIVPYEYKELKSYVEKLQGLYNGIIRNGDNSSLFLDKYITVSMKVRSCDMDQTIESLLVNIETTGGYNVYHDSISVPVRKRRDNTFYIILPNVTSNFDQYYEEKCLATTSIVKNLCLSPLIYSKLDVCGGFNQNDLNYTQRMKEITIETFQITCLNFFKSIKSFCDLFAIRNIGLQKNCVTSYNKSSNIFKDDELTLKADVTLSSGKVINGFQQRISLQNLTVVGTHDIIIENDKPEFRIKGVTVTPTDPLPLDLYQVRVDYTCATNYTLIDMRVSGSDLYTNYAVCSGINPCNCCILHAAGAAGSVVDNILINVTDPWTGTGLVREVVVVF